MQDVSGVESFYDIMRKKLKLEVDPSKIYLDHLYMMAQTTPESLIHILERVDRNKILHSALKRNHVQLVHYLLTHVKFTSEFLTQELEILLGRYNPSNLEIFKLLVSAGAHVSQETVHRVIELHERWGMKFLLDQKKVPHLKEALIKAIQEKDDFIVEILLLAGVKLDDPWLMKIALVREQGSTVSILIQAGAKLTSEDLEFAKNLRLDSIVQTFNEIVSTNCYS